MILLVILFSYMIYGHGLIGSLVNTAYITWWCSLAICCLCSVGILAALYTGGKDISIIFYGIISSTMYMLIDYIIIHFSPTSRSLLDCGPEFVTAVLFGYFYATISTLLYVHNLIRKSQA